VTYQKQYRDSALINNRLLYPIMNKSRIEVINEVGFFQEKRIPEKVYTLIKNKIKEIVSSELIQIGIKISEDFQLINYHNYCDDNIHREIWNKKSRIFDEEFIYNIQINEWLGEICNISPNFRVLDIEKIGYPEIYFRLVRPNRIEDISGPHTDGAYFSITDNVSEKIWGNWVKVWIPICHENQGNTLLIYPKSIGKNIKFFTKQHKDKPRPVMIDDIAQYFPATNLGLKDGDILYFSPYLLHGALNSLASKFTRISIEFAIGQ